MRLHVMVFKLLRTVYLLMINIIVIVATLAFFLQTVGFRVPARHVREYSILNVCSFSKRCPSATCTSVFVRKDVHVFGIKTLSLNHTL
jgi:hypothetical protein